MSNFEEYGAFIFFSGKSFLNSIRVSNSLDPDQALIWVQTVHKGYPQTTKVTTSGKKG